MSRGEGFDVMDLSTSWHDDSKWKAIWRRRPDLIPACAYVYTVLAAESWRVGARMTVQDAWPALLMYDPDVVAELMLAKLIDRRGMILANTWRSWFEVASERRSLSRQRNRRSNDNRRRNPDPLGNDSAVTSLSGRADTAVTAAPVPTGPSVPTDPSAPSAAHDPADDYWNLTGKYPTDRTLGWIDELTGEYGADAVGRHIAARFREDSQALTLMGRVKDSLRREARQLDRKDRDVELERVKANRPPAGVNVQLLIARHNGGQHADVEPGCPACRRAA